MMIRHCDSVSKERSYNHRKERHISFKQKKCLWWAGRDKCHSDEEGSDIMQMWKVSYDGERTTMVDADCQWRNEQAYVPYI